MIARGLVVALCALLATGRAWAQYTDTAPPFVTTPMEVVERMLSLAQTRQEDLVMDLGSGDGRIVIAAAKIYGAHGIGVELDPDLVTVARANAQRVGVAPLTRFVNGDVLKTDLSHANVVTAYLLPWLMDALEQKFLAELAPGTRIVSHAFAMSGWEPDKTETIPLTGEFEGRSATLYYWVVPAQARGEWHALQPEGEWQLEIAQNFQQIDVRGTIGEEPFHASSARMSGTQIEWESDAGQFSGRVLGSQIVGTLSGGGVSRSVVYLRKQ
jgi:SAM-dependent methyltransferase